ncbi:hypothetical protein L1987_32333 [Smallanthus sonchifolius]|uniref:Uncharacterized protein n=1 Tax=Smallanthus sonchifolius TaxID=185202 RepID=A0ACB9I9H6_9ASTR|nr:hypothetical protein L1987_32333 [Smallanthus sonchifolius]
MSGKALDPEFKEIEDEEKELETDIVGEGLDKHLEASSEVCNNKEADITGEGEKELKENQEGNNFLENDIGEESIEKQLETTSEVSKTLEGDNKSFEKRYQDKVRRSARLTNKALSRFTNTADVPICLETEELVQVADAKKTRNPIEQTTNEKGRKRTREVSEKKERLGKEKKKMEEKSDERKLETDNDRKGKGKMGTDDENLIGCLKIKKQIGQNIWKGSFQNEEGCGLELRGIDMVLLPMLENDHYYLIVFELKHTCI